MACYYSATLNQFLTDDSDKILGIIVSNCPMANINENERYAWREEIKILKKQLCNYDDGRIILEYDIPRMGRRIDVTFLYNNIVFILEFKVGKEAYTRDAYDQVYDYALDLKNFQKESHNKLLVPIVVATDAQIEENSVVEINKIIEPLKCNKENLCETIEYISSLYIEPEFNYIQWENSEYMPTPTIVEAAQTLYRNHSVDDIARKDADAINLTKTTNALNKIIEDSKKNHKKSICFVTGVPGAGKTLVGLTLAIEQQNADENEHAVFLSGNFPLVTVLQEALARDKCAQDLAQGIHTTKKETLLKTKEFIQIIHHYRDSFVGNDAIPTERVAIFDEAQRSWTKNQLSKFMKDKKGIANFDYSEPEFLINTMDRHDDWAVIVCLIGGGQEINSGEAGMPEWFNALRRSYPDWEVYVTPQLNDTEYRREMSWEEMISGLNIHEEADLHLATSLRSFRTPDLAGMIKAILDVDTNKAKMLFNNIKDKYPIKITRNLETAKAWVSNIARGTERFGLLASSGALRLKPDGIFVKNEVSVANWFLNDKSDVRSSYYLEDVVTEFDVQGLEMDYTVVGWDADFRFDGNKWTYNAFKGAKWNNVNNEENRLYLKNTYRVLLTRARQGMVIFIPRGNSNDTTRLPEYYDKTFNYLKEIGMEEI